MAKSALGVWLIAAQLARQLGVTPQAISKWLIAGCPSRVRNGRREFDPEAVAVWLEARERSADTDALSAARIRKLRAEVRLMQLRARVAAGELVPHDVGVGAFRAGLEALKQGLAAIPGFAGLLLNKTEAEVRAFLTRELKRVRDHADQTYHQTLAELSKVARREARDELAGRRRALGV